jgi:hypothetical protein
MLYPDSIRRRVVMMTRITFAVALMFATMLIATPVATPDTQDCPATSPNGIPPRGEAASPYWHYENGIYIHMDGDGFIYAKTNGSGSSGWIKAIVYHSVASEGFTVGSRYLGDASSDLTVESTINPAFGRHTPLHVGAITFPVEGCWELTYTTGYASMTFVVDVRFVEEWGATPVA